MTQSNPSDLNDTKRVEEPGDDEPCEVCADREEDCPACQDQNTMTAHDFTRAMYGETNPTAPEEAF